MSINISHIFRSAASCSHVFTIEDQPGFAIPGGVQYSCPVCKRHHGFTWSSTYDVSTPKKRQNFEAVCKRLNITERNVSINKLII